MSLILEEKKQVKEDIRKVVEAPECIVEGGEVDYCHPFKFGLFYGKFLQGACGSVMWSRSFSYPFFGAYLNLQGHRYQSTRAIWIMFWSLKFVWSAVSDAIPVCGKRRLPYIILGTLISLVAFSAAGAVPYPDPYFKTEVLPDGSCFKNRSAVLNPDAVGSDANVFTLLMSFAIVGVAITDTASDALMVEYSQREPKRLRGKATAWSHIAVWGGGLVIGLVGAISLNGVAYGGDWCFNYFTFGDCCLVLAVLSLLGVLNAGFFTIESGHHTRKSIVKEVKSFYQDIIRQRYFQNVCLFFLLEHTLCGVASSGTVKIKLHHARVSPLVNGIQGAVVHVLGMIGMWLFYKYFIQTSWRKIALCVKPIPIILGLAVDIIVVFDLWRNPYIYMSDDILSAMTSNMLLCMMFVISAEVSEAGHEALTFGTLMTIMSVSHPLSVIIGNFVSSFFDVSNDGRYINDSWDDRLHVVGSAAVCYAINCLSILTVYFMMPEQKDDLARKKEALGISDFGARLFVVVFVALFAWIFVFNALTLFPSTSCLMLVGGQGC